jgi:branched-chain amino acid aminotransferase/4-amino-4-deoxychorismate lyase
MIPHDDRALTLGDGLFETVLALDGALVWWDEHFSRLVAGCEALGLPPPRSPALEAAALAALAEAGLTVGRAAVRWVLC